MNEKNIRSADYRHVFSLIISTCFISALKNGFLKKNLKDNCAVFRICDQSFHDTDAKAAVLFHNVSG